MWPFGNRRVALGSSGLFCGFTDWHSHILPGVDDGVATLDESLAILSRYEEMGVSAVWLTPHIMEDVPNATARLRERFAELQAAYHGSVALNLAAENMLDPLFSERLAAGDLLPLSGSRLLVETSYYRPPMGLSSIFSRIQAKGYHPVLAHPERYVYMGARDYRRYRSMGVRLQLNVLSLVGYYGPEAREKAEWMLGEGMYSLVGTDIHRLSYLDAPLRGKVAQKYIQPLKELFSTNL